jgi:hypothetical protein
VEPWFDTVMNDTVMNVTQVHYSVGELKDHRMGDEMQRSFVYEAAAF